MSKYTDYALNIVKESEEEVKRGEIQSFDNVNEAINYLKTLDHD